MTLRFNTGAPKAEQNICVTCGMCCDGTLFLHASLNPGEKGNLPEKIEQNTFSEGEKDYFRLPCMYFAGKCSIYGEKRADVCSSYRCQLLKDLSINKVQLKEALSIVSEAVEIRETIFNDYLNLSGEKEVLCFKQLTGELIKMIDSEKLDSRKKEKYELLLGRCNILEALLIKHLRSTGEFKDLMYANGIDNR